jgi:hypothetical protein
MRGCGVLRDAHNHRRRCRSFLTAARGNEKPPYADYSACWRRPPLCAPESAHSRRLSIGIGGLGENGEPIGSMSSGKHLHKQSQK